MCDSCNEKYVKIGNVGMNIHEAGCPDEWKDYVLECKNCCTKFTPEEKGQTCCTHTCYVNYWGNFCNCEECTQGYPEDEDFGQDGQVD
jgi:hypothetical protein